MADHIDISDEVREFFETLSEPETTETEVPAEQPESQVSDEQVLEALETVENADETVQEPESVEETVEEQPTEEQVEEEEELHPAEKARREQQAIYDQMLAQLRQELDNVRAEAQQQYDYNQNLYQQQIEAAQQAQTQQQLQVTPEQLKQGIETNLVGTFQWVAVNRPDLVPTVISKVRSTEGMGNELADAMLLEYQGFREARLAQQFAQQQEVQQAPQQYEQTMNHILTTLEGKHGETFKAMSNEIEAGVREKAPALQQWAAQNQVELTPQLVADFVSQVYLDIRENKLNAAAAKPKGPQKLAPQEIVENPGARAPQTVSPEQDAMNEILQGAKALGIDVTQAS